jgi:hypothetical protein
MLTDGMKTANGGQVQVLDIRARRTIDRRQVGNLTPQAALTSLSWQREFTGEFFSGARTCEVRAARSSRGMPPAAGGAMRSLFIACAITLISTSAHAGDDDETKSPIVGGLLSAGGTAVAIWGGGGAFVGVNHTSSTAAKVGLATTATVSWLALPSLGHYYAGDWVSTGTVVRAVGLGIVGFAVLTDDHNENDAPILPALGMLTVLTGMVIDIATAPATTREYNTSHSPHSRVSISPSVLSTSSGPVIGIGAGGQF